MKIIKTHIPNHTILFIISGVILILLTISGFFYYSYESKSIRNEKYNELRAIAELKVNQVLKWKQERLGDAAVLAESLAFNWKNNEIKDENKIRKVITIIKRSYKYEDIFILSTENKLLFSINLNINEFDPRCFTDLPRLSSIKEAQITDFYYCPIHKKVHLDIIAPIFDEKGIRRASLILRMDPDEYIYPLIQSWPVESKTSETLLIRKDGDSVLFLNELKYRKNTACIFRLSLNDKSIPAVRAVLGDQGIFEGIDYRRINVLSDIRLIPGTPWFMVAKVDHEEIFHELNIILKIILVVIILLMILFGTGVAWFYHRRQSGIYKQLLGKEKTLTEFMKEFRTTLYSIGDAVITTDSNGFVKIMNFVAENLTGWKEVEAIGKPIEEVFNIMNEDTRKKIETPI